MNSRQIKEIKKMYEIKIKNITNNSNNILAKCYNSDMGDLNTIDIIIDFIY